MILLTMEELLERFKECDTFSLTRRIVKTYNWLTEEEYLQAIKNSKLRTKQRLKELYDSRKKDLNLKIDFEKLYSDIEEECTNSYLSELQKYQTNLKNNSEALEKLKKIGFSSKKTKGLAAISIVDIVGKNTKYGEDNHEFFYNFYSWISNDINRIESINNFCRKEQFDHTVKLPKVLKDNLIKYELSFSNEVTTSSNPMVNYYFKLNDETKAYLLTFENDFELIMEDFALYKGGVNKYYSCTHEEFNSIKIDYRNMTSKELENFIEREIKNGIFENVYKVIESIIKMENGTKFSFEELGIYDDCLVEEIYYICMKMNLHLTLDDEENLIFAKNNEK